ncbi:hypothetical protein HYPSUDRAFT_1071201 [Hypholoma sublateritium FD-334 SS-4]|uniref:Uncharacterized protein n=1 Tax=Hypholoma sublateritium (strain FD-334 SS-4) TaxID=945553 RepID=A0A0D2NDS2_HYPSF|nr:hypothetical protein HYPSUDRAFT_1071201 [Hypholoma sublateritium FD-334 SS-4]
MYKIQVAPYRALCHVRHSLCPNHNRKFGPFRLVALSSNMDQDIKELQDELFAAQEEWKHIKYLNNGDPKKHACLRRVKAAENAVNPSLRGANKLEAGAPTQKRASSATSSTNQPPSAGESNTALSIDIKKELIEGSYFSAASGTGEGSNAENAMDVDAIFPPPELQIDNSNAIPGLQSSVSVFNIDQDSVLDEEISAAASGETHQPLGTWESNTGFSIHVKKEIIEGFFPGLAGGSGEGSKPENAMDVDAMFSVKELEAENPSSIAGQAMEVDASLAQRPLEVSTPKTIPIGPLAHEASTSADSPPPRVQELESSISKASDAVRVQGASVATSVTQNVQKPLDHAQDAAENVNTEPDGPLAHGASAGVNSSPSQPQGPESSADEIPDNILVHGASVTASPSRNDPCSSDHALNAAASLDTAPDSPLVHEASAGVSQRLSKPQSTDSSDKILPDGVLVHGAVDATLSAKQTAQSQIGASTRMYEGPNPTLELGASAPIHRTAPRMVSQPNYRMIDPAFIPPQPPKDTVTLPQQTWTFEGEYDQSFIFNTSSITVDNVGSGIPDNLLGMMSVGQGDEIYAHEELWTIPDADEDPKNQDMEVIAPYSELGASQAPRTIHRSDDEALHALSVEIANIITRKPSAIYGCQYTFKISDVDWNSPIPSYSHIAGDSDSEHRLRLECYTTKAAWMYAVAYSDWMNRQRQMLEEMGKKGVPDVPAFMATWAMCDTDTKALSTRAEEAKGRMDTARKAMDVCFKGKSRATLEYAIAELQGKILSDDDIVSDDLHILRSKLISKKNALRELVVEDEHREALDTQPVNSSKKDTENKSRSEIAYDRLDEEQQEDMEVKARRAFHNFAKLAASTMPNLARLKLAADRFSATFRCTARMICGFLPEAATTSRASALLCLTTTTLNLLCRSHHLRHGACDHDSVTDFNGVAYAKNLTAKGCRLTNPQTPEPNHMHCGCFIDDALLEFFFWKTVTARSTHPILSGVVHHMDDAVTPFLIRSFWVSQFKSTTGLTLDDIYGLNADEALRQTALTARMIQKHVYKLRHQLSIGVSLAFDTEADKIAFSAMMGEDVDDDEY